MKSARLSDNLIETSKVVHVPHVGVMVRVERKTVWGEGVDIEYHWLPMRIPPASQVA